MPFAYSKNKEFQFKYNHRTVTIVVDKDFFKNFIPAPENEQQADALIKEICKKSFHSLYEKESSRLSHEQGMVLYFGRIELARHHDDGYQLRHASAAGHMLSTELLNLTPELLQTSKKQPDLTGWEQSTDSPTPLFTSEQRKDFLQKAFTASDRLVQRNDTPAPLTSWTLMPREQPKTRPDSEAIFPGLLNQQEDLSLNIRAEITRLETQKQALLAQLKTLEDLEEQLAIPNDNYDSSALKESMQPAITNLRKEIAQLLTEIEGLNKHIETQQNQLTAEVEHQQDQFQKAIQSLDRWDAVRQLYCTCLYKAAKNYYDEIMRDTQENSTKRKERCEDFNNRFQGVARISQQKDLSSPHENSLLKLTSTTELEQATRELLTRCDTSPLGITSTKLKHIHAAIEEFNKQAAELISRNEDLQPLPPNLATLSGKTGFSFASQPIQALIDEKKSNARAAIAAITGPDGARRIKDMPSETFSASPLAQVMTQTDDYSEFQEVAQNAADRIIQAQFRDRPTAPIARPVTTEPTRKPTKEPKKPRLAHIANRPSEAQAPRPRRKQQQPTTFTPAARSNSSNTEVKNDDSTPRNLHEKVSRITRNPQGIAARISTLETNIAEKKAQLTLVQHINTLRKKNDELILRIANMLKPANADNSAYLRACLEDAKRSQSKISQLLSQAETSANENKFAQARQTLTQTEEPFNQIRKYEQAASSAVAFINNQNDPGQAKKRELMALLREGPHQASPSLDLVNQVYEKQRAITKMLQASPISLDITQKVNDLLFKQNELSKPEVFNNILEAQTKHFSTKVETLSASVLNAIKKLENNSLTPEQKKLLEQLKNIQATLHQAKKDLPHSQNSIIRNTELSAYDHAIQQLQTRNKLLANITQLENEAPKLIQASDTMNEIEKLINQIAEKYGEAQEKFNRAQEQANTPEKRKILMEMDKELEILARAFSQSTQNSAYDLAAQYKFVEAQAQLETLKSTLETAVSASNRLETLHQTLQHAKTTPLETKQAAIRAQRDDREVAKGEARFHRDAIKNDPQVLELMTKINELVEELKQKANLALESPSLHQETKVFYEQTKALTSENFPQFLISLLEFSKWAERVQRTPPGNIKTIDVYTAENNAFQYQVPNGIAMMWESVNAFAKKYNMQLTHDETNNTFAFNDTRTPQQTERSVRS